MPMLKNDRNLKFTAQVLSEYSVETGMMTYSENPYVDVECVEIPSVGDFIQHPDFYGRVVHRRHVITPKRYPDRYPEQEIILYVLPPKP